MADFPSSPSPVDASLTAMAWTTGATDRTGQELTVRTGGDGSFSLWSDTYGEGFHSGRGALREARETFLNPSSLERFARGSRITVLEVCVGTGCNLAVLLEACAARGLQLDWRGLELDPAPLRLALNTPAFRSPWQPQTLQVLECLLEQGEWHGPILEGNGEHPAAMASELRSGALAPLWNGRRGEPWRAEPGEGTGSAAEAEPAGMNAEQLSRPGSQHWPATDSRIRMLWGDARRWLGPLQDQAAGQVDLIWHDAFSPQRCPQLWTLEVLCDLTRLLAAEGRWISYCSAAAIREALMLTGLQLAALREPAERAGQQQSWSGGTVACRAPLPDSPLWRELTAMELEHLRCSAGEPYRDPTGVASAQAILSARQRAQAEAQASGTRGSSSAWRKRWGVERSFAQP